MEVIYPLRDHHRFLIAAHLTHVDFLDEQIDTIWRRNTTAWPCGGAKSGPL